jgi:hypothetical protein
MLFSAASNADGMGVPSPAALSALNSFLKDRFLLLHRATEYPKKIIGYVQF